MAQRALLSQVDTTEVLLGWVDDVTFVIGIEYSKKSIRWSGIEKYSKPLFTKSQRMSLEPEGLA
jgi:hypothetical protein